MKAHNSLLKKLLFFLLFAFSFGALQAQDNETSVKDAVAAKQFVFEVNTVLPTSGRTRQVGGEGYQIKVSGDSLVSDLPYFGKAYSAPINGEGGIHFISTNFEYSVSDKKKGGWDILIRPKDNSDLREFSLTVNDNGFATLRALSNNRQSISYNGTVKPVTKG